MQRRLVDLASARAAKAYACAETRHPKLTVQFPMTVQQYARAESRSDVGEPVYLLSRHGLDVSDDEASSVESASDIDDEVFDDGGGYYK